MTIDPGARLSHYEVLSRIGAGGMGEVYLAQDTSELGRTVALKILPSEVASNRDRLQRFTQEARTVSSLNHPNILTVYEFGQTDSASFIAAEYIDGVTLREHLCARRLKLIDILDVTIQIVAALNAAHEAGVTHRDLKPENVMVRRDQIVKVLDFGLAKLSEQPAVSDASIASDENEEAATKVLHTQPGMIMGTVSYMSPEQSVGKGVDQRSDIWSLGVVLYEMIAGCIPFPGKDIHRQIIAIQEADPLPLTQQAQGVPERLEEIVTKCLSKDKNERYQTAKDLLIDLRNLRRKLDVDAEIERTVAPALRSTGGGASHNTDGPGMDSGSTSASPVRLTSSAEYIVSEIKQHKRGIAVALLIVLLAAAGLGYWILFLRSPGIKQIESIAVMPFVNESSNADMEYLSDGMTETLISSLSQLPNLNIKPRSIVFRYKGKDADPQTIGNELNVQAVLIGRVASRGADLSLFAELIDVVSTKVIWSQRYNRKQNEIVSLQSEIARDISSKLKIGITNEEQRKVTRNYTENPEAYRHYLRGSSLSSRRKSKDVRMGIEAYEQAIAVDPNYALAYSGLANAHLFMVIYGGAAPLEEFAKARAAALKALELDPTLPAVHAMLGNIAFYQDRDFNALERGTRRALELDPNQAGAHRQNGLRLSWLGRFDDAIASYRRSLELEPLLLVTHVNYGWCLFYAGRIAESDAQLKVAQEIDPSFWFTEYQLFVNARAKADYAAAVGHLARAHELRDEPETAKFIRGAFAKGGWRGFIESALSAPEGSKMIAYYLATLAAESGKKDKAFALLSEAYDKHDQFIFFMKIDPFMDPLRGDPRFEELLKRLGFPQ